MLILYFYLLIGLLFILFRDKIPQWYIGILIFFFVKLIINYRKCTISRMECLFRGVPKEKGILYNFLEDIVDLRYHDDIYIFYLYSVLIIIYYYSFKID